MQPLPIDPYLPRIVSAARERGAVVVVAPPGAGKTTRVPPALLEGGLRGEGRIIVLQPRRIAARAAAVRIAGERGWKLGREAGYQVRFESCSSRETRILIVTEGILTRQLQGNPFLEGVAAVVLDEFHERSLHADLALAMLREIRRSRPDLVVAVMSATLDPQPAARYLGDCPVVECEGRPHPVETRYLERSRKAPAHELAAQAVREAWKETKGHVLVFLPGIGEIRRAAEELEGFAGAAGALITPLHGSLSLEEQSRALASTDERKIVLATNVAETSLTIEGIDLVVDSGLARILRHDPRHGIDRLEVERISRHSADQRAGRAGRLGPGKAVRLWTRFEHDRLPEAETPEIRRVDLASTVLELRAWGVADPASFEWFEAPEPAALERAEELLIALGALSAKGGALTEAGQAMLAIPAHPRLARMLVAARAAGVLEEGAALAALLEERDLLPLSASGREPWQRGSRESGPSDLLLRLDRLEEAERAGFRRERLAALGIDAAAARSAARTRDALLRSAREALGTEPKRRGGGRSAGAKGEEAAILRVLLAGYPDRVARRRAAGSPRGLMAGGRGVALSPKSVVQEAELFLALDLEEGSAGPAPAEARVHLASAVRREWIEEDFPEFIDEKTETWFDAKLEKARCTEAVCYRGLPLEEPRERRPDPAEAEKLLAGAARERAEGIFQADEEAWRWIRRARCLREWMPELGLPALEGAELGEILAVSCSGRIGLRELREAGLLDLLKGRLPFELVGAVERHAPEALQVPSGSRIRLAYEPGKPPVLAVRLQELFGLAETPRVAGGRVAVLLHLLGPNFRPVQVTQDLKSFWNNTYIQVRKDLRARYPRHAWPENPWTAPPQRKPGWKP